MELYFRDMLYLNEDDELLKDKISKFIDNHSAEIKQNIENDKLKIPIISFVNNIETQDSSIDTSQDSSTDSSQDNSTNNSQGISTETETSASKVTNNASETSKNLKFN